MTSAWDVKGLERSSVLPSGGTVPLSMSMKRRFRIDLLSHIGTEYKLYLLQLTIR